jgi:hypothetical protein
MKTVLAAVAVAAFASQAQAVTVVQWDFESAVAPTGNQINWTSIASSTGSGFASAVHTASSAWTTPSGNGSAKSASGTAWAVGDYWQFSFSTVGYTGLTLSFDQTGSNTGPRDFTLAYSANGAPFTTFASYQLPAVTWNTTTYNSNSTFTFDLSAVAALNNASSVNIRLVDASTSSINGGTVASGGTDRVDNFTVNLSPVPESTTSAMLLAGLATLGFIARRRRA